MRLPGRVVAAAAAASIAVLATMPSAAHAHAGLEATSPSASAVLEEPPTDIVLDFDEPIERQLADVRLLYQDGTAVELDSPAATGDATQVVTPVVAPEEMQLGVYVVLFRVTSADSHAISGSFSFQLGTGEVDQAEVLGALGSVSTSGDRSVSIALWVARLAAYAGLCTLLGGWMLAALAARRDDSRTPPARRTRIAAWTALAVTAAGTVGTFVLQGPKALGTGFSGIFDDWGDVAGTRYGRSLVARVVLLALAALPTAGLALARTRQWRIAAGTVGACLLVTYGIGAHPGSGRRPAIGVALDVAHLGAAALWLGGLFVIAVAAREWLVGAPFGTPAGIVVGRFSRMAAICVPVVVGTGLLQTWRLMESVDAVRGTTFGRTLVVKVVVAVLLIVLGAMARYALVRHGAASLRATVVAEAFVGLAVLGLTAGLVSVSPNVGHTIAPVTVTMSEGDLSATLTVTPAEVGSNEIHLVVDQPADAIEPTTSATLRLSLTEQGIENLNVALSPDGADHYSSYGVQLPFAGTWTVQVVVGTTRAGGQESVLLQGAVQVTGR